MENETKDLQLSKETAVIDREKLISYLDSVGVTANLNESQTEQFIEMAQAFNLNPFKREIHAVSYMGKDGNQTLSVITGYEVYIKRAERSGKLDGWKAGVRQEGKGIEGLVGYVEIYRKDWSKPFYHEVYFPEVAKSNKYGYTAFWKTSPRFQIKKVAISQGFRLCFPDELAGMPYTTDELPDDMAGRDVTPKKYDEDFNSDVKDQEYQESQEPEEHVSTNNRANINELGEEAQTIFKDIMHLINKKDGNKKDIFPVDEKIKYKKSADAVSDNTTALKDLYTELEHIAEERLK